MCHVVHVDDDRDDLEFVRRQLASNPKSPRLVSLEDGQSLVEYLSSLDSENDTSLPDLILLDINMPSQDGVEVMKVLKGHDTYRTIPVFMLTTSHRASDITRCLRLGCEKFLTKPYSKAELVETLQEVTSFLSDSGCVNY